VRASIATFQSRNADAPLSLLWHPKKGSFKTTLTPFSRSGWSVVRSGSLAKGGTSKKRPSPHLNILPTRSNKASPRTFFARLKMNKVQVLWKCQTRGKSRIASTRIVLYQFLKRNLAERDYLEPKGTNWNIMLM
jgi:hypothetical protein